MRGYSPIEATMLSQINNLVIIIADKNDFYIDYTSIFIIKIYIVNNYIYGRFKTGMHKQTKFRFDVAGRRFFPPSSSVLLYCDTIKHGSYSHI